MAYDGLFKSQSRSTESKPPSRRSKTNQPTPRRTTQTYMTADQPDLEPAIKSLNAKVETVTKIQLPELYREVLNLKEATERLAKQNEEVLFKLNEAKKRSEDNLFTNVYRRIGRKACKMDSKSSGSGERGGGDQKPACVQTSHVRVRASQELSAKGLVSAYFPSKSPRLRVEGEDSIAMRQASQPGGRYRIHRRSALIHKMCLLLNRHKRCSRR